MGTYSLPLAGAQPWPMLSSVVICPYVPGMLRPETDAALKEECEWVHRIPIERSDAYAYGNVLARHWNLGADLVVIEQDIVPPAGSILAMLGCFAEWCTHPYDIGSGRLVLGLGCVKFSRELQQRFPRLAFEAAGDHHGRPFRTPWRSMDRAITDRLQRRGVAVHPHAPDAIHLHPYPPQVMPHG